MFMHSGLVLEGGGMRGLFTAGVLDLFLDKGLEFPYIIGASAGVCNGVSYVSKQRGRSVRINLDYIGDKRYVSMSNLVRTGSMFGMDFVFDEIPNKLDPFNFDTFNASQAEFITVVTNVETGRPEYFGNNKKESINRLARASSAIPVFSPIVDFEGGRYLDGGTSDPIPVKKAVSAGAEKIVIVLTRDRSFERKPERFRAGYHRIYGKYPNMVRCLDIRHEVYNSTLRYIKELEAEGRAFVIAPPQKVAIGRFEHDKTKLRALYEQGYGEAESRYGALSDFLNK